MNHQIIEHNYKQKENEEFVKFALRLETLWIKGKETTIKSFCKLFINGIRDIEVRRKTKKWFYENRNTENFNNLIEKQGRGFLKVVIDTAENFQKEKDEIVLLETDVKDEKKKKIG